MTLPESRYTRDFFLSGVLMGALRVYGGGEIETSTEDVGKGLSTEVLEGVEGPQ